jgi:predicted membrane protein
MWLIIWSIFFYLIFNLSAILLIVIFCRSLINYVLENALYIVMSQATRYLRDPHLPSSEKQLLKRELGTEMV